jgi:hypothetical protein
LDSIFPLKDGLGLLKESGIGNCLISLFSLDISRGSLQKLDTVEFLTTYIQIVVNKADPITFLLVGRESTRICNIADKEIMFNEIVQIGFSPESFYGKYVYGLKRPDQNHGNIGVRI